MEILRYQFVQYALTAGILASFAAGAVGTIVVSKRIISLCGSIAHAAFGGVGLGYLLRINPSIGAFIFSIFSAVGIGMISKKSKQSEDTLIGIFWAAGMSLGVICIALSKGYTPDLFTYLFGNILAVSRLDICLIALLDGIIGVVFLLFYKEIVAVCFDEEFAQIRGIPVLSVYLSLLILISMTIVILMKVVGIILVIALMSIPPAISRMYVTSLKKMIWLSVGLSMVFIVAGFWIAYWLNLPAGATIILFATIVFLCVFLYKRFA